MRTVIDMLYLSIQVDAVPTFFPDSTQLLANLVEVTDYNVLLGATRGVLVALESTFLLSERDFELVPDAVIVAWCVEMALTAQNIFDDISLDRPRRNDKVCWHRKVSSVGNKTY